MIPTICLADTVLTIHSTCVSSRSMLIIQHAPRDSSLHNDCRENNVPVYDHAKYCREN